MANAGATAEPQGSVDVAVTIEDCSGVRASGLKALHFVLRPVRPGPSYKLKTGPDGHPSGSPGGINVGAYTLRLGRLWNYPMDRRIRVDGTEQKASSDLAEVEIREGDCSSLAVTVSDRRRAASDG